MKRVFTENDASLSIQAGCTSIQATNILNHACAAVEKLTPRRRQSCQEYRFHSLPFQQFHTLLTLFSKSFSPFPHGTSLLSVSDLYLVLDEIYHPICTPIPKSVTHKMHPVHWELKVTCGTFTLNGALFQETHTSAPIGNATEDYNSRASPRFSI